MPSSAETLLAVSADVLGWPYVFGAYGQPCTPETRRMFAGYHPEHANKIKAACPVLSGRALTCSNCIWNGCLCFDCRGFNIWLLRQVGLTLYGGTVTTQWETDSNWAWKGKIENLPMNLCACVFRPGHTGMYLAGIVRHCSGTVKEESLPGKPKWERAAIPAGLYTTEELRKAGVCVAEEKNFPTIRKGATGDNVCWMQLMLIEEDGARIEADGIFGEKTEEAVKYFQLTHGLTVDGICGPKTWAALKALEDSLVQPAPPANEQPPEEEQPEAPDVELEKPPDTVTMMRTDFLTMKACNDTLTIILRKYSERGEK